MLNRGLAGEVGLIVNEVVFVCLGVGCALGVYTIALFDGVLMVFLRALIDLLLVAHALALLIPLSNTACKTTERV